MIDITKPIWCWVYFGVAFTMSAIYGFGAFRIHRWKPDDIPPKWLPLLHQFWLNGLCAFTGWFCGWIVIYRWLSCLEFVCVDEPKVATAVLALAAIVGMTGYLPITIMNSIAALREALARLWPQGKSDDRK